MARSFDLGRLGVIGGRYPSPPRYSIDSGFGYGSPVLFNELCRRLPYVFLTNKLGAGLNSLSCLLIEAIPPYDEVLRCLCFSNGYMRQAGR